MPKPIPQPYPERAEETVQDGLWEALELACEAERQVNLIEYADAEDLLAMARQALQLSLERLGMPHPTLQTWPL